MNHYITISMQSKNASTHDELLQLVEKVTSAIDDNNKKLWNCSMHKNKAIKK